MYQKLTSSTSRRSNGLPVYLLRPRPKRSSSAFLRRRLARRPSPPRRLAPHPPVDPHSALGRSAVSSPPPTLHPDIPPTPRARRIRLQCVPPIPRQPLHANPKTNEKHLVVVCVPLVQRIHSPQPLLHPSSKLWPHRGSFHLVPAYLSPERAPDPSSLCSRLATHFFLPAYTERGESIEARDHAFPRAGRLHVEEGWPQRSEKHSWRSSSTPRSVTQYSWSRHKPFRGSI